MLKGMTAEYLLHRTHRVRAGETVLVHAAAGGVGLLPVPVGEGARRARDRHRLERRQGAARARARLRAADRRPRLPLRAPRCKDATGGRGADVIYDGLGARGHGGEPGGARALRPLGELRPGERPARRRSAPRRLSAKSADADAGPCSSTTRPSARALDEIARQHLRGAPRRRDPRRRPPPLSARRRRRGAPRPGGRAAPPGRWCCCRRPSAPPGMGGANSDFPGG